MKKKELVEVRGKKIEELKKLVFKKKQEIAETFASMKAGQEKNVKKVKNLKQDLAQLLTIISEKEMLLVEKAKEDNENSKK